MTSVLLNAGGKRSDEGDTYISLRSDSIDGDLTVGQVSKDLTDAADGLAEGTRREETDV